ncbi:hypothetical protein SAMN05421823_10160 [Catalinimonas alkaloidigena]|uniref:Outer membrane protein beta-barrel domain-containing protein n=2 Tax=Catalinimonas alkaloidigena TaxID=1075417 RepID=A0A1G8WGE8_9BACT|nr:hypothetical protein SAMN05421823_10160 [Catalinimonas alkaloidigena]
MIVMGMHAQAPTRWLEVGLSANAYKGDLSATYRQWTPLYHAALHFNRKKRLNGSLQLAVGRITGQSLQPRFTEDIPAERNPNTSFTTSLVAAQYALRLNVISREHFKLYVMQGAGLLRYAPKDQEGKRLADQSATRAPNENYGVVTLMLPTSLGAVYTFPNYYGVGFQAGWFNAMSDYLDNVGTYGTRQGNDRIASYRFMFWIPLDAQQP